MKHFTLLILLGIIIMINSREKDKNNDTNFEPSKIYTLKKYRNSKIKEEYTYDENYKLLKNISYRENGSVYDSVIYYYNSTLIDFVIDYNCVFNRTDTNYFIYDKLRNLIYVEDKAVANTWYSQ